jgi:hypothetical protein
MLNGDFVCPTQRLREGAYGSKGLLSRVGPPGAASAPRA